MRRVGFEAALRQPASVGPGWAIREPVERVPGAPSILEEQVKGILGRKVGMTQLFDESGEVVPVTVIEAGPCYVTQVKAEDTDGYNAIQVGFEELPERKLTQGQLGHLRKANVPKLRFVREFRYSGTL